LIKKFIIQKIANEKAIADLYANFENFTQEEKFAALDMITDFNIINEEFQKYIVVYNQATKDEIHSNEYIVIYGDTIHSIAQKETGDYQNWKKIMEFNNLSDVNLEVGSVILIPRNI